MQISPQDLERRYAALSDQELESAVAWGAKAYTPEAWDVLQRQLAERRAGRGSSGTDEMEQAAGAISEPRAAPAVSPYLIVSRLRSQQWPADAPLPLKARDIAGAISVLVGGAGVMLVGIGLARLGPAIIFTEVGLVVGALLGIVLAFAWSANQRPSPLTWYIAVVHFGIGPVLVLVQLASANPAMPSPSVLPIFGGGLWLLYFGRRRGMYGLPPWKWTMGVDTITVSSVASDEAAPPPAPSELLYARFPRRLIALVVDSVGLLAVVLLVGAVLSFADLSEGGNLGPAAWLALGLLYEPGQVAWFGGTIGHRLQNLRVIDLRTGGSLSYLRALVRAGLKLLLGVISFLGMAFTRRHQALHDLLTGSAVCIRDPAQARPWQYVREGEPLIPRVVEEPAPPPPAPVPASEAVSAPPIEVSGGP